MFTSNAFAILGPRALYFTLAGVMGDFTYLRQGLVVILAFVGTKMIISAFFKVPTLASLGVVAGVLLIAVLASLLLRKPELEEGVGHETAREPLLLGD